MGKIKYKDFIHRDIELDGFRLYARDAYDTAKNIDTILRQDTGWFQKPKPMSIEKLKLKYHLLCPLMEEYHPGVIDKILQPGIIRQLGFIIDSNGMVSVD